MLASKSLGQPETSKLPLDALKIKAEAGDPAAECELGLRFARGDGVPKDNTEALKWVRKSADQEYAVGQRLMGDAYFLGKIIAQDYGQAFRWYEKAAKQGNVAAEAALGVCYEFSRGAEQNLVQANEWYRKAAGLNNAVAQNNLGNNLMQGRGIGQDVVQGYKWILLSAAQGNSYALKNVDRFERTLTPSQLAEARGLAETFRSADLPAARGSPPPLPTAAPSSAVTQNVTPTPPQKQWSNNIFEPLPTIPPSVDSWRYAQPSSGTSPGQAEPGDAEAQYERGVAYWNGDGVAKDYSQAVKWFLKSAQQNYSEAEYNLGVAYLNGQGARKNGAEAVKWFLKAAEQNVADAQGNLSYCYMNGIGVRRDDIQACKWGILAEVGGSPNAKGNLAILNQRMSRAAVAQAQQLAKEFASNQRGAPGGGAQHVPSQEGGAPSQNGPLQVHGTGTGFFVTEDGYLITNHHVVKDAAAVTLITRHSKVPASVVEVDAANDLALLKAVGAYKPLPVGSSFDVKLGDTVSTIGFPLIELQGVSPKFTRGEVSSLAGAKDDVRFFQISTQIQPGNSGGALVDEHGNVVGVTSSTMNAPYVLKNKGALPENVNYAIKGYVVSDFLKWALRNSKLVPPNSGEDKPPDMIDRMQEAAVLVVVYWNGSQ